MLLAGNTFNNLVYQHPTLLKMFIKKTAQVMNV